MKKQKSGYVRGANDGFSSMVSAEALESLESFLERVAKEMSYTEKKLGWQAYLDGREILGEEEQRGGKRAVP